jgi:TolA-binding protein
MEKDCDRLWEIDALREGTLGPKDAESFRRHLPACDVCGGAIARDARLRELAASLPASEPNELDLRRLRARVLREVATGSPAGRAPFVPLAVGLAVAVVAVVSWAVVRSGSRVTPRLASAPPASSQRADDAASDGPSHDLADVDREAADAGRAIRAEEPPRAPANALSPSAARSADRTPVRSAPAATGSSPIPIEAPVDDGVEAYSAAVALLRGGQYSAAASAFRAFALAHPTAPQLEDASFLEAAALARAGRPDAAALVAEEHLARFPKSFHRRDAAILVARAARDRGDCAQARAVLAPWLAASPPDDVVRAALGKCDP